MEYQDWLAWLAQFDRRASFTTTHLERALPALHRVAHHRHIVRALDEGHVRRKTYSNGVQRFQIVTGGGRV